MYFLYEIKFLDGYFYIGITKNLKLRFSQHKRSKYPVGIKIRESGLSEGELYSVIFSSEIAIFVPLILIHIFYEKSEKK